MECTQCGNEIVDGTTTCPACGAISSDTHFLDRNHDRSDIEYRMTLGGHRMVTCRRDLRGFMLLLVIYAALMAILMGAVLLGVEEDFALYLAIIFMIVVTIALARNAIKSIRVSSKAYSVTHSIVTSIAIAGIILAIVGMQMYYAAEDGEGSAAEISNELKSCETIVNLGLLIAGAGIIIGLFTMAADQRSGTRI